MGRLRRCSQFHRLCQPTSRQNRICQRACQPTLPHTHPPTHLVQRLPLLQQLRQALHSRLVRVALLLLAVLQRHKMHVP